MRRLYRVEDGSQDGLVGAGLQRDLHVSLQQTGLGEELGLGCKWLRRLCTVGFPLERRTLRTKVEQKRRLE